MSAASHEINETLSTDARNVGCFAPNSQKQWPMGLVQGRRSADSFELMSRPHDGPKTDPEIYALDGTMTPTQCQPIDGGACLQLLRVETADEKAHFLSAEEFASSTDAGSTEVTALRVVATASKGPTAVEEQRDMGKVGEDLGLAALDASQEGGIIEDQTQSQSQSPAQPTHAFRLEPTIEKQDSPAVLFPSVSRKRSRSPLLPTREEPSPATCYEVRKTSTKNGKPVSSSSASQTQGVTVQPAARDFGSQLCCGVEARRHNRLQSASTPEDTKQSAAADCGSELCFVVEVQKRNRLPSASTLEDTKQGQERPKLVARKTRVSMRNRRGQALKQPILSEYDQTSRFVFRRLCRPGFHSDNEFERLVEKAEMALGWTLEGIENTKRFSDYTVNVRTGASKQQATAIYGRTMNSFGAYLSDNVYSSMGTDDVFCDIGHGHGSLVQYTSFTTGATGLGIEMHHHRYDRSTKLMDALNVEAELLDPRRRRGGVLLRNGRLEDEKHRSYILRANRIFCNNYNEVFGARCSKTTKTPTLDQYLAGLFARSLKGTEFVSCHRLQGLPPPLGEINAARRRVGLRPGSIASFYDLEIHTVPEGHDFLSFTAKSFAVYKYTKLTDDANFLCCNPSCTMARNSVPVRADQFVDVDGARRLVAVNNCPKCKFAVNYLRSQRKKNYTE